ncbi:unnamed protein product [Trifolium pratense]|uniref:Uncharacterized protein n=1 Tax=Trifolium pratense TaxID=57577 RepID=A0ACB0JTX2_TRIPR|nr:unnamed protein product [Trifolium pratense]
MTVAAFQNQTDYLALLKFKESISIDPYKTLESWNTSIHFCKWRGILCNTMHERVVGLNLEGHQLHGSLSSHVGNLTFLKNLKLGNNSFYGEIPQELGQLLQLQQLYLTNNSFVGEIPTNLTHCSNLKFLNLGGNHLIGKIPIEIGSLKKLQFMAIYGNNLTGGIPSFVGNLSCLTRLSFAANNFKGDIPQEICHLKNLIILLVGANNFSGTFPSCLFNISSLTTFSAAENSFNGSLPPSMFHTLPNLLRFGISMNQISGPIPTSIINASSSISIFDISGNYFVGQVPTLGGLNFLQLLNLADNNLGDNSIKDLEFLKYLTNCSKLEMLSLFYNNFGGILPNSIGTLSTELKQLHLGIIPTTFGKFQKMQLLSLRGNKLSGDIPTFIGNLSQLFELELDLNKFQGNIPPSIGNCQKLQYIDLSHNKLRGTIPIEVFNLSSLSILLNLSRNSLSGSLPREVGMLKNIGRLDVSGNHLSGNIPITIGECISLEYLLFQGNSFIGTIPSSLASLKGLRYLDLSRNRLSGLIPYVMQNISVLEHLNVSFNMLEGQVPTEGVFGNATQLDIFGNNKLCGGISKLHLPPCPNKGWKHANHHNFKLIAVIVSVPSNVLLDEDMVAHVSDFGIAILVSTISGNSSTIGIKGSVGYAPPEYGMGSEVSTSGDIYSFGILMLEMLTGRRPTDEIFKDGQNLHNFVAISFPDNLGNIFYPHLVSRDEVAEDGNYENLIPTIKECLVSLFKIGLVCSMESPKERMNIADVTRELSIIRKIFLTGFRTHN